MNSSKMYKKKAVAFFQGKQAEQCLPIEIET